ncbi:MAG: hypothetical protein KC684_04880 [Candidatus Omnitrophica bacterium]|nr:hypothetical protein [Candidatus Omnitrophota bacterium]
MKRYYFLILTFLAGCAAPSVFEVPTAYQKSEAYPYVDKAWKALAAHEYDKAYQYADQCLSMYEGEARMLNTRCGELGTDKNHSGCALLNDVAQCVIIQAEVYFMETEYEAGQFKCQDIDDFYFNSYILDPKGWPWKPTEYCAERLKELDL